MYVFAVLFSNGMMSIEMQPKSSSIMEYPGLSRGVLNIMAQKMYLIHFRIPHV